MSAARAEFLRRRSRQRASQPDLGSCASPGAALRSCCSPMMTSVWGADRTPGTAREYAVAPKTEEAAVGPRAGAPLGPFVIDGHPAIPLALGPLVSVLGLMV